MTLCAENQPEMVGPFQANWFADKGAALFLSDTNR